MILPDGIALSTISGPVRRTSTSAATHDDRERRRSRTRHDEEFGDEGAFGTGRGDDVRLTVLLMMRMSTTNKHKKKNIMV